MKFIILILFTTGAHAGAFCGFGTDTCGQGPDQWDIQRMQQEQRIHENLERQRMEAYATDSRIRINSVHLPDGDRLRCVTVEYGDSPFSSTECR